MFMLLAAPEWIKCYNLSIARRKDSLMNPEIDVGSVTRTCTCLSLASQHFRVNDDRGTYVWAHSGHSGALSHNGHTSSTVNSGDCQGRLN